MKLTVITVNYNNLLGLQKTMQSVFEQSFSDFEYIVIDGASTDGSENIFTSKTGNRICDELTIENNFHRCNWLPSEVGISGGWLSEPDKGVYNAMNKGIRFAKGDFLLFLNSGDFLINKNVLKEVFEGDDYDEDIICGRCNLSKKGKVVWTTNPPSEISFGTLYNEGLAHQSTFIKRKLFSLHGFYREDFNYNSDIDFWYKTIILGNCKTKTIETIVSDYNLEGMSSTANSSDKYKDEMQQILTPFTKFVIDYDNFNKETDSMRPYYWAKRQKLINFFISVLFRIAVKLSKG